MIESVLGTGNLSDGVTYFHRCVRSPQAQSIHVLTIDPSKVLIQLVKAGNVCTASDKISTIAQQESAIAAINGGFCCGKGPLYGTPSGVCKIKETWFTDGLFNDPMRTALTWNVNDQHPAMHPLAVRAYLACAGKKIPVTHLNQERSEQSIIVYTPAFSHSTLTGADGIEYVVENGKITDVRIGQSNAKIPTHGFVISAGQRCSPDIALLHKGAAVELVIECFSGQHDEQAMGPKDFILGGAPLLVAQGQAIQDFNKERVGKNFIQERHARTAVGILPNNYWLLVVVDGYEGGCSEGMTLPELADFMVQQGCVHAVNLSGGASSTLWADGSVKNAPGKKVFGLKIPFEKEISDAIIIKKITQ